MSLITEFMATEQLVKAIYLTLLHSLWQGAAIAGIAGMVMMFGKRLSSASRYTILAGCMAFFVLCTIATFTRFTSTPSGSIPIAVSTSIAGISSQNEIFTTPVDQLFSMLSSYSNRIVLLWFLIICLKSLQLYLGFQRISNLKTKQTSDPESKWSNLVNTLSKNLLIHKSVKMLESGLISVPLTVGYLKPVILVPFGMLAAIPSDQVEAILLHELAHIKRKDYFVNIFQAVVEVLFFFNPAIWWLSSLIRAERENCCDDIAIANSSSKINYVRALISFEEYRAHLPQFAVAFSGSENALLKRTRRIIYNQNNTLNSMEKFILTSGLVLSGLLSLAFTEGGKEQINKTLKPVVATISEAFPAAERAFAAVADTIPASSVMEWSIVNGGTTTFKALHKGKTYRIVMKDDEVTDLYVNDIKVSKEKLGDYTESMIEIFELAGALKTAAIDEGKQAEEVKFAAVDRLDKLQLLQAVKLNKLEEKNLMKLSEIKKLERLNEYFQTGLREEISVTKSISNLSRLDALGDTVTPKAPTAPEAAVAPVSAPGTPASPKPVSAPHAVGRKMRAVPAIGAKGKAFEAAPAIDARPAVAPAIEVHPTPAPRPVLKAAPKVDRAIEVNETPVPEKPRSQAQVGFQTNSLTKLTSPVRQFAYQPTRLNRTRYANNHEFSKELNKELISEGLVKDPNNFSYKINNQELIINGVKQSEDVHSRIISKVLKNENHTIEFIYSKR